MCNFFFKYSVQRKIFSPVLSSFFFPCCALENLFILKWNTTNIKQNIGVANYLTINVFTVEVFTFVDVGLTSQWNSLHLFQARRKMTINIHFNASKKKCVKKYAIGCNELYGFIYSCAGSYIRFVFCSR